MKIKNTNFKVENEKLKILLNQITPSQKTIILKILPIYYLIIVWKEIILSLKKSLELNQNGRSKDMKKNKEEQLENNKKSGFHGSKMKSIKNTERKMLEDDDIINDINLKDITVMMSLL